MSELTESERLAHRLIDESINLLKYARFEEAFESISSAIELDVRAQDLYLVQALCLMKMKRIVDARKALLRELFEHPENAQAREMIENFGDFVHDNAPEFFDGDNTPPDRRIPSDVLWVHLHTPRTCGETFLHTARNNLAPEELLVLDTARGIAEKTDALTKIKSLGSAARNSLRLIHGNGVFYGIHECFHRPVRYITFLRAPEERLASLYNSLQERANSENLKPLAPFPQWVLSATNDMSLFLSSRSESLGGSAQAYIDACYFVGITEFFEEDALFLFEEIGMEKIFGSQNVSPNDYALQSCESRVHFESIKASLRERLRLDGELYQLGSHQNVLFKAKRKDFLARVQAARMRPSSGETPLDFRMHLPDPAPYIIGS